VRYPLILAAACLFAQTEDRRRTDVNLLGKVDAGAGESRRNENIQFNLVDNNALKELNVRLGATATLVEQFEPSRGYFGAEYGNPPSAVLHLAPSAKPGWHGSASYQHQNSALTARAFFQAGGVRPAREHRYGFRLGGVPWKSGFLSLQAGQEKLRGQVNGNVLVPLREERTALAADPAVRTILTRWLAAFPDELPNRTEYNPRALNTNAPQRINGGDAAARLEQDLGTKDRVFAQHAFLSQGVEAFQLVAGQNPNTSTRSHRARLTWARNWNERTVSSLSAGFDRVSSLLLPEARAIGPMVSTAGLTTLGPLGSIPIDRAQNTFRYEGQLSAVRGDHSYRLGGGVARRQFNGVESDTHRGFYSFSNDFGRTGIENLRLGTPSQYIISLGDVGRGFRQWMTQLYAGDVWKASPSLTLNYGLRWETAGRPREVNRRNAIAYDCDCNNFSPSFGFAWRPVRLGTFRGAYGAHYGDIFPVTYTQVRFSPPGSVKLAIPAPNFLNPLDPTAQSEAKGNLYLLDPELASPYAHQYNFSWEPRAFKDWRVQLGYVGSRAHKLLIMWYLNRAHPVPGIPTTTATINQRRANPDLAEIRWVLNGSRGYFDAARVTVVAPRVKGLTLETAYWFSKAMDLGADYTNTAYDADSRQARSQSEFETHKDRRALSLFDQPHAFLTTASYQFPKGVRLSGVVLLKKGTPFSVTTLDGPGFGNVDGNGNDRPHLRDVSVLGATAGHPDESVRVLRREAFALLTPGEEAGNLGANTFRKGGIRNVNASLEKEWPLSKGKRFTLRAESINLFNTPQFAEPGSVLGTPEFGTITNTLNDGRTFRFGAGAHW
jgi:hypothetical protein